MLDIGLIISYAILILKSSEPYDNLSVVDKENEFEKVLLILYKDTHTTSTKIEFKSQSTSS